MKRLLYVVLGLAMAACIAGCSTTSTIGAVSSTIGSMIGDKGHTRNVGAKTFARLIEDKDVQLLDVRPAKDFREGHIEGVNGCENISFQKINFMSKAKDTFNRYKRLAVYSEDGKQSAKAAKSLAKAGYKVINLRKGYEYWTGKDYPVTAGRD